MIHDKICESRKVNSVSCYAEALWVRIITKADDNGNYWRDPFRIHANCMYEKDGATVELTTAAVKELSGAGLLLVYKADGREYVHIADFHQYQELRGDRNAQVEHPLHPAEMGGAYIGEGLRRDVWSDRTVTEANPTDNRVVTDRCANGIQTGTPEVEVKDKVEVEEEVATTHREGNFQKFRNAWKDALGRATKPKPYDSHVQKYQELCRRFGEDEVLDAINSFVELHGKPEAVRNKFADRDFLLDEAEDLIVAKRRGTLTAQRDEDRLPRLVVPD